MHEIASALSGHNPLPSTLYEMLKSFSTVASTLNVTHAANQLPVTRQTIIRHIMELEELLDCKLFELVDRQYALTKAGSDFVIPVNLLLNQTHFLFRESSKIVNGLSAIKAKIDGDYWYHAQRHPVVDIWTKAPPLIQHGMQAWVTAKSWLYSDAMDVIRPYLMVYRRYRDDWICVEIGEKSSYASWLGPDWAKSAIGLNFEDDPIKSDADKFMLVAHENVARTGSAWYEHISTKFARVEGGELIPINYQKLITPIRFPNGQPGITVLVARTNNVEISIGGELLKNMPLMPEKDIMEFDI
ncbi:MAG: LysR family transcriptional regulator [Pseudomonadota bacterium]